VNPTGGRLNRFAIKEIRVSELGARDGRDDPAPKKSTVFVGMRDSTKLETLSTMNPSEQSYVEELECNFAIIRLKPVMQFVRAKRR
jgi:hypothetical protein